MPANHSLRPRLLLPSHCGTPGGPRRPRAAQERPLPPLLHPGKPPVSLHLLNGACMGSCGLLRGCTWLSLACRVAHCWRNCCVDGREQLWQEPISSCIVWLVDCRSRPASCGWCKCSRWRRWRRGSPQPSSCCGARGTASFQRWWLRWRRGGPSRRSRHLQEGQRALLPVATALPSSHSWGMPPPCGWQRRSGWPSTRRRWVPLCTRVAHVPLSAVSQSAVAMHGSGRSSPRHAALPRLLPLPAADRPAAACAALAAAPVGFR